MTGHLPMTARTDRRLALCAGTAMAAALVLAATAAPAMAQGFNGTIAGSSGVSASNTDVTVLGSEGVINWNASAASAADTNIDFLPSGETVTFHDAGSSSGDFTVLNRVFPTFNGTGIPATISLSGTVSSTVNGSQGGNVWFYSPYGIIANGTAQFNVGSLLLTTSDIDTSSGSLYLDQTNGNKVGFLQATQPGSFVRILPGAQLGAINSSVNSAYVGIFAPRIEQGGTIRSNGTTALVAGEAGTITFNAGLLDISVSVGTSDANGIVHTGSTGGQASLDGEPHTVALVAVPKNTALTMLLSGSLGNDAAAAGITDNSAVVLYAGSSSQADATKPDYDSAFRPLHLSLTTPVADTTGNISIGNTVFISPLRGLATGTVTIDPLYTNVNSPGLVDFQQGAEFFAGKAFSASAQGGDTIQAAGALSLLPMLRRAGEDVSISITGDPNGILAPGAFTVGGALTVNADGAPASPFTPTQNTGADGKGGTVNISVAQGSLSATGGLFVSANGIGEDGLIDGGKGTGGSIDIAVSNKGSISAPSLFATATGAGGYGVPDVAAGPPAASAGGDGFGGSVALHDDGGSLQFTDVGLGAEGQGGNGAITAGGAIGGLVDLRITGGTQNWSNLTISAGGFGGFLQPTTTVLRDVSAQSNGVKVSISGSGALNVTNMLLDNSAITNAGSTQAYSVTAGGVDVQVSAGGSLNVANTLSVFANAELPGETFIGDVIAAPVMTGGRASVVADNGTISVGAIQLNANAYGLAAATTAGRAQGGTASLVATNGGTVTLGTFDTNRIRAEAQGAVGPVAANATGGTATVTADNGTISSTADIIVSASAMGGGLDYQFSPNGTGYDATGGTASVDVLGATGSISVGNLVVYAKGEATEAFNPNGAADLPSFTSTDIFGIGGNGGTGTGGTARVNLFGNSLSASTISVQAYGVGGASDVGLPNGYTSGTGQGGTALLSQTSGTLSTSTVNLSANGQGGMLIATTDGQVPANGGNAAGGTARASFAGGTATLTQALSISAGATGGDGMASGDITDGGVGGNASNAAGLAELLMPLGSTASLTAPAISISAVAIGGQGGTSLGGATGAGGSATGGTARINLADGGISVAGPVGVLGTATGGAGGTGGNATGGTAAFLLTDTLVTPSTTRSLGPLLLDGSAAGGAGATAAANGTDTAGTTKFAAQAGRAASALTINGDFLASATGTIAPAGDGFTGNFGSVPVDVTGAFTITTPRDINATTLAGGGVNATGALSLSGRTINVSGSGVLGTAADAQVLATNSINLGGLSAGGTTLLSAFDPVTGQWGAVSVGNLTSTGLVTAQTGSLLAASPGALSFANSFANAGGFSVQAAGNLDVATVGATGAVSLASTGGAFHATGPVTGNGIVLQGATGATTDTLVTSQGALTIGSSGGSVHTVAALSGNGITLQGATGVTTDDTVTSTGGLTITSTGGAFTAAANLTAAGNTLIDAFAGITAPSLSSGGTTFLRSTNGTISIGTLLSTGAVTLFGRAATVTSTGPLAIASATTTAGDLVLSAVGNLTAATVDATGAVTLSAPSGAITASSLSATGPVTANGLSVNVSSPGSLSFANSGATSGSFTVSTAGSATFANLTASSGIGVTAGGAAMFNGLALAPSIRVGSGDISIGNTGRLGQRGLTSTIALSNTVHGAGTFIGGSGGTSGWNLDSAEALRLFADQGISIAISAQASAPAPVTLGNLSIAFGTGNSANIGAGGSFAVFTPGVIRVTGAVAPVMASNQDLVSLSAGQRTDVVTDTGSVVLRNGNAALTGTLEMSAPEVRVATASALSALDRITSLPAATTRLDSNDGAVNTAGAIQANALQFNVATSTLYIQNSGIDSQFANRRGFTANSLSINGLAGAQPSFVINGVLVDPDGQLLVGRDTYGAIVVNGVPAALGGPFNPLSTVNGCAVGLDCSVPTGVIAPPHGTIEDLVKIITTGSGDDTRLNLPIVQFGNTPLLNSPPLIDEPVTGVGNDDLWQKDCPADKDCRN